MESDPNITPGNREQEHQQIISNIMRRLSTLESKLIFSEEQRESNLVSYC